MLKQPLYRHQRDAVRFTIENDGKCALFHEPGLGKTRTALEAYKYFRTGKPNLKLFVVCPLSLVNAAWGEDIQKFTAFSYAPFKEIKDTLPDIVIINYEGLISKRYLPQIHKMITQQDFMCVLDESSRLKNHKSVTTRTLLRLTNYFNHRLIASGTPMPNSELELWGQINFIHPRLLPSSFYAFRNTYFHLERNGRTMIMQGKYMTREVMREILSKGWKYVIDSDKREDLMDVIKPFTHWVKKKDALDLPEKIDEMREVTLTAKERKAYTEMKNHLVTEIEGTEITVQVALAKLMKLRQATSGFFYSERGDALEIGKSSKMKELSEILEELGNQQVIVWVQFHHEVKTIRKLIADTYGEDSVATLYSETKDKDGSINKFKNNDVRYLIAHPKSAGHGLTFINCSTMVFYSLDYSYESHAQARERIHRIGQKNSCLYLYIIAKDSIDGQLLQVLQKKQSLQDIVYAIVRERSKK